MRRCAASATLLQALRVVRGNPILLTMTLLAGGAALFVGNAYQAQMPSFATELGHGNPGLTYWMLLAADAAGAIVGAVVLESRGSAAAARPVPHCCSACSGACAIGGFALDALCIRCRSLLLFCAGFLELSFNSMAQALVQLNAPVALRGHVIGIFMHGGQRIALRQRHHGRRDGRRARCPLVAGALGGWRYWCC